MRSADLVMEAHGLQRDFHVAKRWGKPQHVMRAVRGVDLYLRAGEILALVGESGCGKSTLARMLLGLIQPTSGDVRLMGQPLSGLRRGDIAKFVQPVFQDPYFSLNPSKRVDQIISLPLIARGGLSAAERRVRVARMMDLVRLPGALAGRMPAELSGGQRQRVAIARALIAEPRILICDEPTSALDVSVQAQIINLLQDLRKELGLSYLLVTHNLAVVQNLADRVAVMYFGSIVEVGPTDQVLSAPHHPYTRLLCSSVLLPDPAHRLPELLAEITVPDPHNPPTGCAFHPRCPGVSMLCTTVAPRNTSLLDSLVACHHPISSTASAS